MGLFGGSSLTHQWLICACTPVYSDAPASIRAQLDDRGVMKRRAGSPQSVLEGPIQVFEGQVTPDGYVVNTRQPAYQPSGVPRAPGGSVDLADAAKSPVPPQTARTIGDALSARGISWAWYGGAWTQALADGRRDPGEKRAVIYNRDAGSPIFQPHHQPFNYFARFAPGTAERASHLKDGGDFLEAIERGSLPRVSFYKPPGRFNQHPSYTDIQSGDIHISDVLERLEKSPQWRSMLVVVTYDENGGDRGDHVPPAAPGWGGRLGAAPPGAPLHLPPPAKPGDLAP